MKRILIVPILLVLLVGCVTTGPGGKKSLILIPTKTEVELGKEVVREVESTERVLTNTHVQNYVSTVGRKVARVCDRKDVTYTFKVLDSDEINAFACPGGFIYIYKGLMKKMDNEAQLAAVLAHEVGHIVARHSVKRLQAIYGYSIVMEVALGDKMGKTARQMVDAATGVILLGYGRENEYEADDYGILYAKKANYNPRGMVQVFQKFKEMEGRPPGTFEKLLMSHPPAGDRINNGNEEISKVGGTNLPYYESEYAAIKTLLE
ncbi:MAG: M48 family metalloprotease [candidate division WOR-3 bacterium]|nr:MAG: M48 family metalloprotease [candidate division WOR-3 bacterium]